MSELRERCLEFADKITTDGFVEVADLETFAKEQRLKGMEDVRNRMTRKINALSERLAGCDEDYWINHDAMIGTYYAALECIDAEIKKLKEVG